MSVCAKCRAATAPDASGRVYALCYACRMDGTRRQQARAAAKRAQSCCVDCGRALTPETDTSSRRGGLSWRCAACRADVSARARAKRQTPDGTPFRPLPDRVLIRPDVRETGDQLIELVQHWTPDYTGTVIAVGPRRCRRCHVPERAPVQVGQRVVFSHQTGQELRMDGARYIMMWLDDVLAVMDDEPKDD